ncbi:MAG: RagB/SusD family nutrient uptake outer membrane protein [Draconibacterium sp.]
MKQININRLLISLALLFFLSGCQDWLTIEPENKIVKENFWKSQEDVDLVVGSTYNKMRDIVDEEFLWGEIRSDFYESGNNITSSYQLIMEGNIFPDNNFVKWEDYYKVINQANLIIDNAPAVRDVDLTFTEEELNTIVGQMLFLRSYCLFKLAKAFRDVPMPLVAFENDYQDYQMGQTSQHDIFLQIIEDMKTAENILPEEFTFEDSYEIFKGKATKYAAKALMADVYLWLDEPQLAIDKCDEILTSGKFALMGITLWFQNFRRGGTNESIMEIYANANEGQANTSGLKNLSSNASLYSNRYFAVPAEKYELLITDPRGLLRSVALSTSESNITLWKWLGGSELSPRDYRPYDDANWILYRLAEIFLIKAEAAVMLDDYPTARAAINTIRNRAGAGELSLAENAGKYYWYQAVLDERLLELAGEGKRWYDLVRIASRDNFAYESLLTEPILQNVGLDVYLLMKSKIYNHDFWYLPIHEDELRVNKNLVQNEYYKTN